MNEFSIITVSYNSENTIKNTIDSVLNQSFTGFEYIIVDGGSKDSTLEIILSYKPLFEKKGIDYKWVSEPDQGIYDAMNKGISMSTKNILSFINSDDWYLDDTLEVVNEAFDANKLADLVYGNIIMIKENEQGFVLKNPKRLSKLSKEQNLFFPSVFIKRTVIDDSTRAFDIKYKLAADYKFLLKTYLNKGKFYYLNKSLANYRLGGSTTKMIKTSWREVKDIQIELGRNKIIAWLNYYEKILKRLILKITNRI